MKTTLTLIVLSFLTAISGFSQIDQLVAENNSINSITMKMRDMELPAFIGGQEAMSTFIRSQIKYPELAFKQGVEGTVLVNFRISKEGKIINPYVSQGIHSSLDQEALRLVSEMPDWIPARQNGEPREVAYQIPVRFEFKN